MSDVVPEPIRWLWDGHLARGKLHDVGGDPGLGKSTITLDLASRVTIGKPWPDGQPGCDPAGVVLISVEDGIADVIRRRLGAADAPIPTAPAVVIASAPGRWYRIPDPENYQPYDMGTIDSRWQKWQRTTAARLGATLVVATEAGHRVHMEAPDLVALTITATIQGARASQPPTITPEQVARAHGTVISPASAA